jgi:hypothetical protein
MLLSTMQTSLATLYETPVAHCVNDFLVTDAGLAQALENNGPARNNNERLLLRQTEDGLDISLFIDATILDALDQANPLQRLDADNLNEFLIALEGVSHFHYVVWHAMHARPVTQLELEIQAEVDKFVTAMMTLDEQGTEAPPDAVHDVLFRWVSFDTSADAVSEQRYREANHYAGKYCRGLLRRFPARHRTPTFVNELRRFYRLPQNDKIRLIEQG